MPPTDAVPQVELKVMVSEPVLLPLNVVVMLPPVGKQHPEVNVSEVVTVEVAVNFNKLC